MKRITILKFITLAAIVLMLSSFSVAAFAKEPTDTIKYKIRLGDTLHLLSLRFSTTIEDISLINPKLNPNNLIIGGRIKISVGKDIFIHAVKKGDTLFKIAEKYDSTIDTIAAQNYIKNPDLIYTGDTLAIPKDKKVLWLTGKWAGFAYSSEVSQADYDGAYALYSSMSEEKLDNSIKDLNEALPRAFDEEGKTLPDIPNPRAELSRNGSGNWDVSVYLISTRMGTYGWTPQFVGTLSTNRGGFTNRIPVNAEKFAKALYLYELKKVGSVYLKR